MAVELPANATAILRPAAVDEEQGKITSLQGLSSVSGLWGGAKEKGTLRGLCFCKDFVGPTSQEEYTKQLLLHCVILC